jgi:hypothetical protein
VHPCAPCLGVSASVCCATWLCQEAAIRHLGDAFQGTPGSMLIAQDDVHNVTTLSHIGCLLAHLCCGHGLVGKGQTLPGRRHAESTGSFEANDVHTGCLPSPLLRPRPGWQSSWRTPAAWSASQAPANKRKPLQYSVTNTTTKPLLRL